MRLGVIRRTRGRTVVETAAWKMRLVALACLASAGVIVVLAVFVSPLSQQILLAFCALPFAFAGFVGLATWRAGGTSIVSVTDEGLEFPIGYLRWNEIELVDFTTVAGRTSLGIWTYDPFVLARRGNRWWLWVLALLARIQGIPLLSFTDFTVPIGDLYGAIETRRIPTRTHGVSSWTGTTSTSPETSRYIVP